MRGEFPQAAVIQHPETLPAPAMHTQKPNACFATPSNPEAVGSSRGTALAQACSCVELRVQLCSKLNVRQQHNTKLILTAPPPLGRPSEWAAKHGRNHLGWLYLSKKVAFSIKPTMCLPHLGR